jgi:hypothetical protein
MSVHEIGTKVIMDVGFTKIKNGPIYGLMDRCSWVVDE